MFILSFSSPHSSSRGLSLWKVNVDGSQAAVLQLHVVSFPYPVLVHGLGMSLILTCCLCGLADIRRSTADFVASVGKRKEFSVHATCMTNHLSGTTHTHTHTHTHTYTHVCTTRLYSVHTQIHTHVYAHILIYTRVHTHTHTHTHTTCALSVV